VCDSRPNEPGFDRYVSTTGSDTGNCGNSASPCASIQYAFDQALNGDIIKVSQGTYYENISINFEPMEDPLDMILIIQGGWTNDFKARNDDPSLTIIDGAGETVFEMLTSCSVGGLFVDLTIEGFTITNGSNGFYAVNEECLTKITFVNNIITVNSDTGVTSHSYYGVMTIEIINNNISGNSNGVYIDSRGTAILRDNFIADNNGFGLVMVSQEINEYVTGILINNVIVNNNASGIYAIADSLFFAAETRVLLMNNTIVGNNYEYGGGIYARSIGWALTNVDIINTIVWGNSATVSGNDIYLRAAQGDEGIVVINASFSDIGNVVNDLTYPGIYNDLGNNINVDPFFANPANGDYHVTASSQCIDAGTNDNAPLNDLDRETRPFDGDGDATATTDIGADEFVDTDTDSLADYIDNCLLTPNGPYGGTCTIGETYKIGRPCMGDEECEIDGFCSMNQEDSYGYGIGDACYVCEGNFNCDQDVDGGDAYLFKSDFGRSTLQNPCTNIELCNGDFLCDGDVDGADAFTFKRDFGRSQFHYPCPACAIGVWCVYP